MSRFGFDGRFDKDQNIASPGPVYDLPEDIVAKKRRPPRLTTNNTKGERSAWMQEKLAATLPGPDYTPKDYVTGPRPTAVAMQKGPKSIVPSIYISQGHERVKMGNHSPGPKYNPLIHETHPRSQASTFSARYGQGPHSVALGGEMRYITQNQKAVAGPPRENKEKDTDAQEEAPSPPQARPLPVDLLLREFHTSNENNPMVGPAAYSPRDMNTAFAQEHIGPPRACVGNAARFGHKYELAAMGLYSPGPKYNTQNHSIGHQAASKTFCWSAYHETQKRLNAAKTSRRPTDRSSWLRGTIHTHRSGSTSGAEVRSLRIKTNSGPGPGEYNLPSDFGGARDRYYYDPLLHGHGYRAQTHRGVEGGHTRSVRAAPRETRVKAQQGQLARLKT